MYNILCFGDSNTFGSNPAGGRHPRSVRWTGLLQNKLGEDFYVIEEGMGGRTTVWDDPLEPNRCGIMALPIALQSHKPLDLVIISLGTNDCKTHLNASPRVIARGMEALCRMVKSFDYGPGCSTPQLLLISPIHIGEHIERCPFPSFDSTCRPKSMALSPLYNALADQYGALFLDAARIAVPSELDQLHMDAASHKAIAEHLYNIILSGR